MHSPTIILKWSQIKKSGYTIELDKIHKQGLTPKQYQFTDPETTINLVEFDKKKIKKNK